MSAVPRMDGRQAAALMPMSLQGRQRPQPRVPMGAVLFGGKYGPALSQADQDRLRNEQDAYYKDRDFARQLEQDEWARQNKANEERRAEAKEYRDQTKFEAEMGEKAEKRQRSEAKAQTYAQGMLDDITHIRELAKGGILPAFGPAGIAGRRIPGTNAHAIDQTMESIKSRVSLSALQEMRNNSPTGAAMGNVSDKDTSLLENSITSLNLARNPEEVERSLQILENNFLNVVHGEGNWQRDKNGNVFLLAGSQPRRGAGSPVQGARPQPRRGGGSELPPGFKPVN